MRLTDYIFAAILILNLLQIYLLKKKNKPSKVEKLIVDYSTDIEMIRYELHKIKTELRKSIYVPLDKIKPIKQKLMFITYDGVEYYEDDCGRDIWMTSGRVLNKTYASDARLYMFDNTSGYKFFSTRDAAEDYIRKNHKSNL